MRSYNQGMSLRDYFAAAALQGMMSEGMRSDFADEIAKGAYKVADEMIKQRNKDETND